jgi:hypothetical protein
MGDGSATGNGPPDEQGPEHDLLPDLPPSWVPKLTIPHDMLDMRCPRVSRWWCVGTMWRTRSRVGPQADVRQAKANGSMLAGGCNYSTAVFHLPANRCTC